MRYAIIEESGGQRKVTENDEFLIDLLDGGEAPVGKSVKFDKVLLIGGENGAAKIGRPYVAGASITAEVTESVVMGDKVYIYKHAEKKTYKRKTGHRQRYTKVKVTGFKG